MRFDWIKEAILGSTYARALANKAQRTGVPFAPEAFDSIAQQQRATLDPHASAFVRGRQAPGELPMTQERAGLTDMLHKTPWATDEHSGIRGGSEYAVGRFNQLLDQTGRSHTTPAGQPDTHQRILSEFGPPQAARRSATQAKPAPGSPTYQLPGGFTAPVGRSVFELMDEPSHGGTRVGPAPAPSPGQRASSHQRAREYPSPHTFVNRQSSPLAQREMGGPHTGAPPPGVAMQRPRTPPPAPPRGHASSGNSAATMVLRKTGSFLTGLERLVA